MNTEETEHFLSSPCSSEDKVPSNGKEQKKAFNQIRQIFIMGSSKSGKSTFFNQLKRLYGNEREMDKIHIEERKEMIELYIFHAIADVASAMPTLSPPIRFKSLKSQCTAAWFIYNARNNFDVDKDKVVILFKFLTFFKFLWEDGGFQEALQRSKEYKLREHAKYFFAQIDTIFDEQYIPTEEDILRGYIFPSIMQKLEIDHVDLGNKNTKIRRQIEIIEIQGSVSYKVVDLGDQIDKEKCLPCLDNEDLKHDIDYVSWLRERPKFVNYSIIFVIDSSSTEKLNESFNLLRTIVERYQCCCFMIAIIVNKWDKVLDLVKHKYDDDEIGIFYDPYVNHIKASVHDQLLAIKLTSRSYTRKSSEWMVRTTGHEIFTSALNIAKVKDTFVECCGLIERMELRAQFEQQKSRIKQKKQFGLTDFDSSSLTYGSY